MVIDEEASARFAGRLSAFLYLLSGGMLLLALLVLPAPPRRIRKPLLGVAVVALVAAGVIGSCCRGTAGRRGPRCSCWSPTFVLIALNNAFDGIDGFRYAPFFFITFAWIGLTQRRVDLRRGRSRSRPRPYLIPLAAGRPVDVADRELRALRAARVRAARRSRRVGLGPAAPLTGVRA